jgi:protein SCO1/2
MLRKQHSYQLRQLCEGLQVRKNRTITAMVLALLVMVGVSHSFASTNSNSQPNMSGMNMSAPTPPPVSGTPAMMGGTILNTPIPHSIENLTFTDANGKKISLNTFKGKTVVLTDFFTSCDMICPMTTANMRNIGDTIAASKFSSKFAVLELTVDPGRDTVSRIKAYQALYGEASPTWTVATGNETNIKNFWNYFGVYTKNIPIEDKAATDWQTGKPEAYDVQHDDVVMLIDPKGHFRWLDLGVPAVANAKSVPLILKKFLSKQGQANLDHPNQNQDWDVSAVYGAIQQIFGFQIGPKTHM